MSARLIHNKNLVDEEMEFFKEKMSMNLPPEVFKLCGLYKAIVQEVKNSIIVIHLIRGIYTQQEMYIFATVWSHLYMEIQCHFHVLFDVASCLLNPSINTKTPKRQRNCINSIIL